MNRYQLHIKTKRKTLIPGDRVVAFNKELDMHLHGVFVGPCTSYKGFFKVDIDQRYMHFTEKKTVTPSFSYPLEALSHE